jgi:RNase adaptor protein for sRNA GlmZ degradation
MINSKQYAPFDKTKAEKSPLKIVISSFSYKKGLPEDNTEHGGGFVFDCRAIENPGRYQPYAHQTGQDEQVINFLRNKTNVEEFLMHVYHLVDQSVENYIDRNFEFLAVHFGCTGGQHRSVYCAESMSRHLKNKYGVKVILSHREKNNWPQKMNLAFKGI